MTTLSQLIAAVERAEGADRKLMCAAFKAVFPKVSSGAWDAIDAWDAKYDWFCAMLDAGAYLDAAMSLVPEGYEFATGTGRKEHMTENGRKPWAWCAVGSDLVDELFLAATPALALCAAALRAHEARAAMEGR